jgi:hypothetical protein
VTAPALIAIVAATLAAPLPAARLAAGAQALRELIEPAGPIARAALDAAFCVGVIPASGAGKAVLVCRTEGGPGPWGPPLMMRVSGKSRRDAGDALVLVRDPAVVDRIVSGKAVLGGDLAVEPGTQRRRLEGVRLSPDADANAALHGRALSPRDVLLKPGVAVPDAARELRELLMRLSPGGGTSW